MSVRVKLREISEASVKDPRQALIDAVGDTSGIEVFHNLVLIATYVAPPKILKGPQGEDVPFYLTDRGQQEDRFQGKCGLVLKMGPLAFKDDGVVKFGGVDLKVGDWVLVRPSDGLEMFKVDATKMAGTSCRLFEDAHIKGRLADPALVW
jgi:hypothetical protein